MYFGWFYVVLSNYLRCFLEGSFVKFIIVVSLILGHRALKYLVLVLFGCL